MTELPRLPAYPSTAVRPVMGTSDDVFKTWAKDTKSLDIWANETAKALTYQEIELLSYLLHEGPVPYESIHNLSLLTRMKQVGLVVNIVVSIHAMPSVKYRLGPNRKIFTPGYYAATQRGEDIYKVLMRMGVVQNSGN